MGLKNSFSLLLRHSLAPLGLRLIRLTPDKVRGVEPILDLKSLLHGVEEPIIFDVGANDGETAQELLEEFSRARLVAFEPFEECFQILKKLFQNHSGVRIENTALGATSETKELNLFSGNRMNSFLELDDHPESMMKDSFSKSGASSVKIDTLDRFCHSNNFDRIDILKIDTQGFDLNVLKGATRMLKSHKIKTVLIEVNFVPMYKGQPGFVDIHQFLSSFGYRLVDFYNQTRKNGFTAWCDACYVAAVPGAENKD